MGNTVNYMGLTLDVRDYDGAPGPNKWSPGNVTVDDKGALHLNITHVGDQWPCAEARTQILYGSGTSEWHVQSDINALDPGVCFGLFIFPHDTPATKKQTEECDIEITRWRDPNCPPGKFTVFPEMDGYNLVDHLFKGIPAGPTVHKLFRTKTKVMFAIYDSKGKQCASWTYAPKQPLIYVPQKPLLAYFQLWLVSGKPPINGKPVEIIIPWFKFTPYEGG
jgi:hypothetical protein